MRQQGLPAALLLIALMTVGCATSRSRGAMLRVPMPRPTPEVSVDPLDGINPDALQALNAAILDGVQQRSAPVVSAPTEGDGYFKSCYGRAVLWTDYTDDERELKRLNDVIMVMLAGPEHRVVFAGRRWTLAHCVINADFREKR